MSKGPGRIERAIETIFDEERDNAFTVEELCERIYGVSWVPRERYYNRPVSNEHEPHRPPIAQKHRNAVIRAARNVGKRRPEIRHFVGEGLGGTLVFFRHDEILSYAMASLKADRFNRYRSNNPRVYWTRDEKYLRKELANEQNQARIAPGGAWWRHVQMFLAERDGDTETFARLQAEDEAARAAWLARLAQAGEISAAMRR